MKWNALLKAVAKMCIFLMRKIFCAVPNMMTLTVPDAEVSRQNVIALHHDNPHTGHLGTGKIHHSVLRQFWLVSFCKDVAQYVNSCDSFQRNESSNQLPAGLIQPQRFESMSVDLIIYLDGSRWT